MHCLISFMQSKYSFTIVKVLFASYAWFMRSRIKVSMIEACPLMCSIWVCIFDAIASSLLINYTSCTRSSISTRTCFLTSFSFSC